MDSKNLLFLAIYIFFFSLSAHAQKNYTVEGIVYDRQSNQPIKNAQVWLYGTQVGAVTDSLGNFKFEVLKTYSRTRMYVRVCGDDIASSELVQFGSNTQIITDFSIEVSKSDCLTPSNIPWKVSPSEYESYQGYLILAMHGVFIRTCSGNIYSPVWPVDYRWNQIWPENSRQGDSLFIQLEGRLDPYSKNVFPFQNLYVGKIVLIDSNKAESCN
ncbi:MAG: carboxypeptidase-like regulatory domain-containing protein [Balneolales bacterium]|nr:carboxypeptidase-like regulatory domain-containing protein [Balneolales bacterium]